MNTEQEYINGCYTRYGTRPPKKNEIKNATTLSNGMFAVAGFCKPDGYSIDIYKDPKMEKLIYMQHNVHGGVALIIGLRHQKCYLCLLSNYA